MCGGVRSTGFLSVFSICSTIPLITEIHMSYITKTDQFKILRTISGGHSENHKKYTNINMTYHNDLAISGITRLQCKMAHAPKPVFVFQLNGRIHVLTQRVTFQSAIGSQAAYISVLPVC
jgi:hypothetical protein